MWWTPPAHLIEHIPKGGASLAYLGHADTTRALIECDPGWTWTPTGWTGDSQPAMVLDDKGNPVGLWILLTVCGVTRPAYGSCEPGKREAVKELIGDAIRNGAMRFGVAGGLWSKATRPEPPAPVGAVPEPAAQGDQADPVKLWGKVEGPPAPPGPEQKEGAIMHAALVKLYGEEAVKGALAFHSVARYSELTPAKVTEMTASLSARAALNPLREAVEE